MEDAVEVARDVHQLKVPIPDNPLGHLNSYLFKSDDGCLLVDTGWNTDEAFGSLARQLGEAGVSLADLKYIVITHIHPDHFGLAGRLKQHTKAQLVVHEVESTFLESRYRRPDNLLDAMDAWLRMNGAPENDRPQMRSASMGIIGRVWVTGPDIPVHGGEHFRVGEFDLEVIWTPGHSPGHICLYDRNKRIFTSGDHILPGITPNVSMHTQSQGNPMVDYLDSLSAVEGLPTELVLPAHEDVFHDLAKRVAEIREHHEARKQDMIAAFGGEAKTAYQVAGIIPWNTMGVAWEDLGGLHKRSAVMETLAHLELLRAEGVLTKSTKNGVVWYAVAKRS